MAKHKADISIGHRMDEECERLRSELKVNLADIALRNTRHSWREGCCPGAFHLMRLHYMGGDVLYVLTGKRRRAADETLQ